jgi:16S rRNA (guanine966-N2)-methyltransferase
VRIIAGEHRGRLLKTPPGQGTRPMLDRVREAVFSTLGARVEGARVLDLFAGTGALSLEALSRGAASARMVERDARVVRLLRDNVAELRLEERATIVAGDALVPATWGEPGAAYELVFLDPPYPLLDAGRPRALVLDALRALAGERLAPGGLIVFHAPVDKLHESEFGPFLEARLREYGTNAIWYLEPRA